MRDITTVLVLSADSFNPNEFISNSVLVIDWLYAKVNFMQEKWNWRKEMKRKKKTPKKQQQQWIYAYTHV